ncbi:MAG: TetR/AcrR family transcriptional repressor of nem operon [Oleiphilaceae bacterium]|jgi:AcrR family transcriptional regulator
MKRKHEAAVHKATNLYWEKGFHATSMRNLQEVINMRPGSIYASFGSKEALFKESLRHYAKMSLAQITRFKDMTSSPLEVLKMLMKSSVIENRQSAPSGMCMLVKTIAELTEENAELLAEAKRLLHAVEQALTVLIDEAKACGELDPSKDSARVARFFQVQLIGVRTYARANDNEEAVNELIEDVFKSIPLRP